MRAHAAIVLALAVAACGADDAMMAMSGDAPSGGDAPATGDAPSGGVTCGSGTTEVGGLCTAPASPYVSLRVADATIGANGHTGYLVRAIAVDSTGVPLAPYALIAMDRPSAGTLSATTVTLSPLGGTATFVPCESATVDCLGSVTFSMSLPSAPATVVASTTAALVVPTGVSSAAPCLDGGPGTIVTSGYDWRYVRVDRAAWVAFSSATSVELHGRPSDPNLGDVIDITGDAPLGLGIYEDTPLALDVLSTGDHDHGRLEVQANSTHDIVISWEQPYDHALEGCMRYTTP